MATNDQDIRGAIGNLLIAAFAAASPAPIVAQVYPWNALAHNLSEWPGMFRLASGGCHGWVVKESGESAERKNGQRDIRFPTYDVWGFYKFRSGKKSDNSDDEFSQIRTIVYDALKAEPRLGLDEVEKHELLQWDRITTMDCGEETLHFAQGRLKVRMCC